MNISQDKVLDFWFKELTPAQWFSVSDELDLKIKTEFSSLLEESIKGDMKDWRQSAQGSLAEIILLDQFSRNIYRETPKAFSQDELALEISAKAITKGFDKELSPTKKSFLYMPFMHSELIEDHVTAVKLFSQPGLENNLDFEIKHKVIIERFGRYPHRNDILGRESSKEEIDFLKEPNSSF
jgi:uncharacterized protein (DUF924 family)